MLDAPTPSDRNDLAAELALGLLEGEERAQALRLCLSDPAFAAQVEAWGHRLSPMLDLAPQQTPPGHIWSAIVARIGATSSASAAPERTVRRLRFWRGSALLSGAIAASLALVLVMRPAPEQQAPGAVGLSQLADAQGAATMAISYDPQSGVLRMGTSQIAGGAKSPELWVIPADGVPRSLGIIDRQGGKLAVNEELRAFLQNGATLAITLEDAATAPHAAPTSAPILTGKISII